MENKEFITIGESTNVLKLGIRTKDGKDTGEILEFNLKDIELLDKLQKMWDETKKNKSWINNQLVIIEKKQDFKKKGQLMSNNEKLKYDAIKTFYMRQKDTYNIFLGENGIEKLLYGRPFEWETLAEVDKIINEQIVPRLDITMKNITDEIKGKYNFNKKNNENVLVENE